VTSTPGARRVARWRMLLFATLVLCFAGLGTSRADEPAGDGQSPELRFHQLPNYPKPPQQNHPPLPEPPPPPETEVPPAPPAAESSLPPAAGGTAGTVAKGGGGNSARAPRPPREVIVPPAPSPPEPKQHRAKKAEVKEAKAVPIPIPGPAPAAPAPAESSSERSNLADRILAPTELDLSAENLAEGGLLAFLLVALLYLPVMIFNKATEKNHATISGWFARPRALLASIAARIPFAGHPLGTLAVGIVASTALFAFVEPHFPTEEGAWQYALGMLLGFTLVSTVFFATWRWVVHRLEPQSAGRWVIYLPFILLAALLVVMARLAHFLPGVVLGTVAEYEPAKKLNRRTAGIRVATTYGALMILGLVAWFAWIPVTHAAEAEHASNLTLILDSMLAITFVSSLESVAFGLIPMKFLDGNELFSWHKGLWALMWGAALFWFAFVILNPALSTYGHVSDVQAIWLGLLFSSLMLVAISTWGYFRLRDARLARAERSASG
jgi:hypothetical protein